MRLSAFAKDLAGILFGRSERRFAKDVLRDLGIEPDLVDRLQSESETKTKSHDKSKLIRRGHLPQRGERQSDRYGANHPGH